MAEAGGNVSERLAKSSPSGQGQRRAVCEALSKLTAATRAITINLRNVNVNLERILMDKEDIEDLEKILSNLECKGQPATKGQP